MIFYQISFGPYRKDKYDEAEDLILDYLASLYRNGQIHENYDVIPWNGEIVAYANALGYDANLLKHHSHWGREKLHHLNSFFGQKPEWRCNEDCPGKYKTNWKDAPYLYFVVECLDWRPPLARGDNGMIIPLYRVPITDEERDLLCGWVWRYKSFDGVWIGCGELEMQAYRVLADPESECSKWGREHCQAIEKATGVPTYYYLMRYFGREYAEEKKRRCPCCGKSWLVKYPVEEVQEKPFWKFDFQCKKCRLVSHFATDVNLRYAKIGEPRTRAARSTG